MHTELEESVACSSYAIKKTFKQGTSDFVPGSAPGESL